MSGTQSGDCEPSPHESYGFTANWPGQGTCPSPNGGAGQGQQMDPLIRGQFVDWLAGRAAGGNPWMATVSFVNPHDIAWYHRFTATIKGERAAPHVYRNLPANFETEDERKEQRKPLMQLRGQQIENESFGVMPPDGTPQRTWTKLLDTYLHLQRMVDRQIAQVLDALAKSPFADNTIVVFVADHGEYGGAHGMRGKGFGFYDEGIRVPLVVKDPTASWTAATHATRDQLVESVDLAPLMLTLATGSSDWRGDSTYAQIARRADIAAILGDPKAPGRPYVAHATDEPGTSSKLPTTQQLAPAPNHVTGVRTRYGKFARYAFWKDGTLEIDESKPVQYEAYDYRTKAGRMELENVYRKRDARPLVRRLEATLQTAMEEQIQQPLPAALQPAQDQAMNAWFSQPPVEWTPATDN
jgi:arylsulfatase A-like enzyme